MTLATASVLVDSLTKTYTRSARGGGVVRALDKLSLQVGSNEIFALLGPNGAGKSTLIKILLGVVIPTGGTAKVLGYPISDHRVHQWIGFLPEQPRFPLAMSVSQVLRLSGELSGLRSHHLSSSLDRVVDMLDLREWRTARTKECSKGILQRVAIGQALIHDPRILFLDEPSDGLDPMARRELRNMLKNLRDVGKTIFLNSHLLSEVEIIADRIAILNKGKLLKVGCLTDIAPPTGAYCISLRKSLPDKIAQKLTNVRILSIDGKTALEVDSADEMDRLQELLRHEQIAIESIHPRKPTLEDSYISLITNELPE